MRIAVAASVDHRSPGSVGRESGLAIVNDDRLSGGIRVVAQQTIHTANLCERRIADQAVLVETKLEEPIGQRGLFVGQQIEVVPLPQRQPTVRGSHRKLEQIVVAIESALRVLADVQRIARADRDHVVPQMETARRFHGNAVRRRFVDRVLADVRRPIRRRDVNRGVRLAVNVIVADLAAEAIDHDAGLVRVDLVPVNLIVVVPCDANCVAKHTISRKDLA